MSDTASARRFGITFFAPHENDGGTTSRDLRGRLAGAFRQPGVRLQGYGYRSLKSCLKSESR